MKILPTKIAEEPVFGDVELSRRMPSGAVEQQDGVRALCDMTRDFIEMKLHGGGVYEG